VLFHNPLERVEVKSAKLGACFDWFLWVYLLT